MFSCSRQRIASTLSSLATRQQASLATASTLPRAPTRTTRCFHASSSRYNTTAAADNKAADDDVVPIVWTTHRLSQEQIAKVDAVFHKVLWLDLFETSMLTEIINQRLGITMNPKQRRALQKQMDSRALGGAASASSDKKQEAAEDEGPKLVDLKLAAFDAKAKIKVIKEVRAIAGLGLKEAKELVESAPKVIQKGLTPEAAQELKTKLEEIGATVELV